MPSKSGARILGIDPGFDRLGVAIVEGTGQKQNLLHSECVVTSPKQSHEERLLKIGARLREVLEEWEPEALAIEKLFFNKNVSTAIKVAEARGVIIYLAAEAGLEVYEYFPQDVKIAVAGYGHADKTAVEAMTKRLVKRPADAKKLDDEMDAIALCITHLATMKPV